jgi:hypothetical protein
MTDPVPSPLNDLSEQEIKKMSQLRELVQTWNLEPEEQKWCTDLTLYRYLLGLQWDIEKASKQLKDTVEWRKNYRPQDIKLSELEPVARSGWMFYHGYDKQSRPILYIIVERDETGADDNLDLKFRHIAYILEKCFESMPPNVYNITWIVEFKNVSLSIDLVKKLKNAMGNIGEYYPENLYRIFVLNVGWIVNVMFAFARTFMTKHMLDKYIVAKYDDLLDHVDSDQLIQILGGNNEYEFDFDKEVNLEESK